MPVTYRFHSLEDFLASKQLTVDGEINDGWGALYPVKGREIEATIMFADMTAFSTRTLDLSPTEMLVFVNQFFTWVTAEALQGTKGIVDKYIGDALMIVFSKEFGSEDPFAEAVRAGMRMSEHDVYNFVPHIGIASGNVIVGHVGTPIKYDCSVFGRAVVLAARCAGERPPPDEVRGVPASIVFPAAEWGSRSLEEFFSAPLPTQSGGTVYQGRSHWQLLPPRGFKPKNLPAIEIREAINDLRHLSTFTAEGVARDIVQDLRKHNRCWSDDTPKVPTA